MVLALGYKRSIGFLLCPPRTETWALTLTKSPSGKKLSR